MSNGSIRRLLYVCGDHGAPTFGRKGASTHIREMIRAFRRAGVEVLLAASDLGGDRRDDEDFHTVALPRPRSKILGFDGRYIVADFLANSVLRETLARFQPDAVYERSALYFGAGERLARSASIPRILEVNTVLSAELAGRLKFPGWARRREAGLFRRAERIAAISETLGVQLQQDFRVPAGRIRPFTMAVNPDVFRPPGRREDTRRRAGFEGDVPVLGLIGSMNHYHRPGWFFDLARRLSEEDREYALLIVGGKERKIERFRKELQSSPSPPAFHFTGPVAQRDMPAWFEAMDLVVIPGAAPQSTPTKLFEAAAMGLPIVAPDEAPIQRLMSKTAGGLLFDRESPDALHDLVARWLDDPASFAGQADAFRDWVLSERTWQVQARRALDWLAEEPK